MSVWLLLDRTYVCWQQFCCILRKIVTPWAPVGATYEVLLRKWRWCLPHFWMAGIFNQLMLNSILQWSVLKEPHFVLSLHKMFHNASLEDWFCCRHYFEQQITMLPLRAFLNVHLETLHLLLSKNVKTFIWNSRDTDIKVHHASTWGNKSIVRLMKRSRTLIRK